MRAHTNVKRLIFRKLKTSEQRLTKDKWQRGCWPELGVELCSISGIELGPGLSSQAGVVRVAQVQGHNGR